MTGSVPIFTFSAVTKSYPNRLGVPVVALSNIDLAVAEGRITALIGESGSGKSTLARLGAGLLRPDSGAVLFRGAPLSDASGRPLAGLRRSLQMVFQDPSRSLDPRQTVGAALAEVLHVHRLETGDSRRDRIAELLDLVQLPTGSARRMPHEFSGGQRQRIAIARALAVRPTMIIADEIVSALDVSVQAQVLNLLLDLQAQLGLSVLFITHDLGVARYVSTETVVLQHGRLVEAGPTARVLANPVQNYTRALLAAVPRIGTRPLSQAGRDP